MLTFSLWFLVVVVALIGQLAAAVTQHSSESGIRDPFVLPDPVNSSFCFPAFR